MNAAAEVSPLAPRSGLPAFRWGRALLSVVLVAICVVGVWPVAMDLGTRPIRSVRIAGEFRSVSRDALRAAIALDLASGFFHIDVDSVRAAALELPWVRDVSVRRVWPGSLHIKLVEREAVARWNTDALLEGDGAMFKPDTPAPAAGLPALEGPAGQEALVLARYREFSAALGSLEAGGISRLRLDSRGSWRATLGSGLELLVVHEQDPVTLARYARALARLFGDRFAEIERIDMRYPNGFTVRWQADSQASAEGKRQ